MTPGNARKGLQAIEDAIVESIMGASEEDLRADLIAHGQDPDGLLAQLDAAVVAAKAEALVRMKWRVK